MEKNRTDIVDENLAKFDQFSLTSELRDDIKIFLNNSSLTELEINDICRLMERSISQHYVKQLLKDELLK